MPIQRQISAGKPYMPSNGTEGLMFEEQWCASCIKRSGCTIVLTAMAGKQPKAWKFDDDGKPECTSFQDHRKPRAYRCGKTDDLFG